MKTFHTTLVLLLIICGCAARPLKTDSGYPEADIQNSDGRAIAEAAVNEFGRRGYHFAGADPQGLLFEKLPDAVGDEMYGGQGVPTKLEVRLVIVKLDSGGHKLIASGSVVTQIGPFANRQAADNKGNRQLMDVLKEIRKTVEP